MNWIRLARRNLKQCRRYRPKDKHAAKLQRQNIAQIRAYLILVDGNA